MSCRFCLTHATSSRQPTEGQAENQAEGQIGVGRAARCCRADSAPEFGHGAEARAVYRAVPAR
jgi:hypothetical protein